MKKRFDIATVIALMLMVCVTTWVFTYMTVREDLRTQYEEANQLRSGLQKYLDVRDIIKNEYIGPWNEGALIDGSITGMVSFLADPWSQFLTAEQHSTYINSGDLSGIGIAVRQDSANQGVIVNEVHPDSPASEANIQPLDVIIAINDVPFSQLNGYYGAIESMRGEDGEVVKLTLVNHSDGLTRTVSLVRRKVILRVISSTIFTADNIGYVRIRNFNQGADADFITAIDNLVKAEVKAIVFDVRNNDGGKLETLCSMLDPLLPEGNIITTINKEGVTDTRTSDANALALPMVVLCNNQSISAAEFFAAALQEYGIATIIGEKTSGKGYAQEEFVLSDKSALVLSVREYLTPNGISLANKGVTPDKIVALDAALAAQLPNVASEQDTQLMAALDFLREVPAEDEPPVEETANP